MFGTTARRVTLVGGVAAAAIALAALAVSAQTGDGYAEWTLAGAGGNFTGTMTLPPGFPQATFTSDSRAPAALPTGATAWLPVGSPFGAVYGSSQGRPYANLRPAADNATSPSTTTYTFASPTPPSGWGFAFGDIDADSATVTATDADGDPVPSAGLGFEGVFNYCDTAPRAATCAGQMAPFDLPGVSTTATSVTLDGNGPDSVGATGWFQPTVPVSSITIVFTWNSGFPTYQTWFASVVRSVAGTVTVDGAPGLGGVEVAITDPEGNVVATTVTEDDGSYGFAGLGPVDGYQVAITVPDGYDPVGPTTTPVDLNLADATDVDFDLTLTTHELAGCVTDAAGVGVGDVPVVLLDPEGAIVAEETTDTGGGYLFAGLLPGTFTVMAEPPAGFEADPIEVVVPATGEVPCIVLEEQPPEPTTTTAAPTSTTTVPTTTTDPTSSTTTGAPGSTPADPGDELPATGSPMGPLVALGVLLVLAGSAVLASSHRGPR